MFSMHTMYSSMGMKMLHIEGVLAGLAPSSTGGWHIHEGFGCTASAGHAQGLSGRPLLRRRHDVHAGERSVDPGQVPRRRARRRRDQRDDRPLHDPAGRDEVGQRPDGCRARRARQPRRVREDRAVQDPGGGRLQGRVLPGVRRQLRRRGHGLHAADRAARARSDGDALQRRADRPADVAQRRHRRRLARPLGVHLRRRGGRLRPLLQRDDTRGGPVGADQVHRRRRRRRDDRRADADVQLERRLVGRVPRDRGARRQPARGLRPRQGRAAPPRLPAAAAAVRPAVAAAAAAAAAAARLGAADGLQAARATPRRRPSRSSTPRRSRPTLRGSSACPSTR